MKLWEVMKALEENPGKKFESPCFLKKHEIGVDNNGYLRLEIRNGCGELIPQEFGRGAFNGNIHVSNMDWQLVKTPVTWQEAIEAWADYKTIYCIDSDGQRWTYEWHNEKTKGLAALEDGIGVSPDEINLGTWYIEED